MSRGSVFIHEQHPELETDKSGSNGQSRQFEIRHKMELSAFRTADVGKPLAPAWKELSDEAIQASWHRFHAEDGPPPQTSAF